MSPAKSPGPMKFGRYDYASFLGFAAYAASSVIIPVSLLLIARSLHFPLEEGGKGMGGALQVGRSIPMVVSMLFCGMAAAKFGKVKTVGFSLLLMGGGILFAAASFHYLWLLACIILAGVGEGMIEGLATPVVQDLHEKDGSGRYINFTHSFWSVGMFATVLIAGAMLSWGVSWRIVLLITGLFAVIPALLFLLPSKGRKFPETSVHIPMRRVFAMAVDVMKIPRFWLYFAAIFVAGGGEYCLSFWVSSFIQLDFAQSAFWGGVGTGMFSLGMIAGRMGCGYFVPQKHICKMIVIFALAGLVFGGLIPFTSSLWVLMVLLFLSGLATAPFWPSIQSCCVDRVNGDSTTIFIILSMSGVPGCGFFSWLMGFLGDRIGLKGSFVMVPLLYVILAVLMGYEWYSIARKKTGKAGL